MRATCSENVVTVEADEDVEFEFADNDENVNIIDENDMNCVPKGIVKVSLPKYAGGSFQGLFQN